MSLNLIVNEDTEVLFEKFYESYSSAWTNPFKAPALLAPNRLVDKWLNIEWAHKSGIVCGLKGIFLESFFWRFLCQHTGENRQIIHAEEVAQWILDFWPQIEKEDELNSMKEYVQGDPVKKVQIANKMARLLLEYELSRPQMGWYEKSTQGENENFKKGLPGILETWGVTEDYFFPKGNDSQSKLNQKIVELESWQKHLYQLLFVGESSWQSQIEEREDQQYSTLARWLHELREANLREDVLKSFAHKHPALFFWSTGLSLFHRQLLMDIACYAEVNIYQLNPCAEFWEDVDTTQRGGRKKLVKQKYDQVKEEAFTPFALDQEENWNSWANEDWNAESQTENAWFTLGGENKLAENKLLQSWGHIGKENIALWSQMVNYDFDNCLDEGNWSHEEPTKLLPAIKHLILNRKSKLLEKLTYENQAPDTSLLLVEVPGLRREVEVLRLHILKYLKDNPDVGLNEIGVFAPDPSKYRAYFEQVFNSVSSSDPLHIPFKYVDETAGESSFFKGLLCLLELVEEGRFDRQKVFEFLRNPIVMNAKGYDFDSLKIWEDWAEATCAFTGFNAESRMALGEVSPEPWHSFRHALDRILLDGVVNDDFSEVSVYGDRFSEDAEVLGGFVRVIEELWFDISTLRTQLEIGLSKQAQGQVDWKSKVELLKHKCLSWLSTTLNEDMKWDHAMKSRIAAESGMGSVFRTLLRPIEARKGAFEYRELFYILKSGLESELDPKKSLFTGQLMVMTLKDGRPMPWKASFILGMGEGEFPGVSRPDPLDLRMLSTRPGDSHPVRQAKYAFLELLMCTSEQLYISWNSRNLAKDAELMPGSVVLELEDFVRQGVLNEDCSEPTIKVEEQKEANPNYWGRLAYSIQIEEDGLDCRDDEGKGYHPESRSVLLTSIEEPNPESLESTVDEVTSTENTSSKEQAEQQSEYMDFRYLKAFLKDPLEATLTRNLNLWDNEEGDSTQVSDEPLSWDNLQAGIFRNQVVAAWQSTYVKPAQTPALIAEIIDNADIDQWKVIFENHWSQEVKKGRCPAGSAGKILKESLFDSLNGVFKQLTIWHSEQESSLWQGPWKPSTSLEIDMKKSPEYWVSQSQEGGEVTIRFFTLSASSAVPEKMLDVYLLGALFAYESLIQNASKTIDSIKVYNTWVGKNEKNLGEYLCGVWDLENIESVKQVLEQSKEPKYQYQQIPFASIASKMNEKAKSWTVEAKSQEEVQNWCEDQVNDENSRGWYPKEVSQLLVNQRLETVEPVDDFEEALSLRFAGVK